MAAHVDLQATSIVEENTYLAAIGLDIDPVDKTQCKIPDHTKMLGCSTESHPGVWLGEIKRLKKLVGALVVLSLCLSCIAVFFVIRSESSIAGGETVAPDHDVHKTAAQEIASVHDEEEENEDNEDDGNQQQPMYQGSPTFLTFRPVNPSDRFVHPPHNSTPQFKEYAADTAEVVDMIDLVKDGVTDFKMLTGSTIQHVRVLSMANSIGDTDTFRVNARSNCNEVTMNILLMCIDQPWGPAMEDCHIVVPLIDTLQQSCSKDSVSTSQTVSLPQGLNRSGTAMSLTFAEPPTFAEHTPTGRRLTPHSACRRRRIFGDCFARRRGYCSRRRWSGECCTRRRGRRRRRDEHRCNI